MAEPLTQPWRHHAACLNRPTNYWYPDTPGATTPAAELALSICRSCPVTTECLQYALNKPEYHGIWGATTEQQRRGLRSRRTHQIRHGTNAGYQQHTNWGVPVCDDCRRAHAEYQLARRRIRERAKTRDDYGPEDF